MKKIKYCGECSFLSITEKQQKFQMMDFGYCEDHFCKKYGKRVLHQGHHPNLVALDECYLDTCPICGNNESQINCPGCGIDMEWLLGLDEE